MKSSTDTLEEVQTASSSATFYGWKYKHYFVIVEEGEKNIRARCKLCAGKKTLSCAWNTTSNFKKQLEKVHKNVVLEAKEVEGAKVKANDPGLMKVMVVTDCWRGSALYHLCWGMFLQQDYGVHFLSTLQKTWSPCPQLSLLHFGNWLAASALINYQTENLLPNIWINCMIWWSRK